MTEPTTRADIEAAKTTGWTARDFAPFPEYSTLTRRWDWFQNQKIGLLLHWGLYSKAGIVESWQLSDKDAWARGKHPFRPNMRQLKRDYWGLAQGFDPPRYDPAAWAKLFKQAGIRYTILTTKHHDGFNLFDTQFSDFKVKRDLVGPFVAAMQDAGITPGLYYSKADWHHPDYWRPDGQPKDRRADYEPGDDPERWGRFVDFTHKQLLELTTNYGPLGMLWLDAGWVNGTREPLGFDELMPEIRAVQPDMLVVDRTMGGRYEQYVTPERRIPALEARPAIPWESNIPLSHDWGDVPHADYKDIRTVVENVLQVVTLGGNIVLGVGPRADGTLPRQAVALLEKLGAWLQLNGAGIYNTRAASADLIRRAAAQRLFITEDAGHYYLFPKAKVPSAVLDLTSLGLADQVADSALLGTGEPLVRQGHQVLLPGGLRQRLLPGIRLTKRA
ncbi:alpha-L-fucosidase [Lacticaseibacillus kribbianus]|uniref:alpha-L-fucosidase n=1 Tax=Lacticaseibacillus kribbianus TaxID=2926292 RepID=UPI001CD307FB|nr:alpha-L-fucosidase [Lacticaseibacillus kribbianus]